MNTHIKRMSPRNVLRTVLAALCIFTGGILNPTSVQAGVGIAPVSLQFDEALRGGPGRNR
jgi:hypothetical protein